MVSYATATILRRSSLSCVSNLPVYMPGNYPKSQYIDTHRSRRRNGLQRVLLLQTTSIGIDVQPVGQVLYAEERWECSS
jgi:uncharacterized protein (DUF111 family)